MGEIERRKPIKICIRFDYDRIIWPSIIYYSWNGLPEKCLNVTIIKIMSQYAPQPFSLQNFISNGFYASTFHVKRYLATSKIISWSRASKMTKTECWFLWECNWLDLNLNSGFFSLVNDDEYNNCSWRAWLKTKVFFCLNFSLSLG